MAPPFTGLREQVQLILGSVGFYLKAGGFSPCMFSYSGFLLRGRSRAAAESDDQGRGRRGGGAEGAFDPGGLVPRYCNMFAV